MNYVDESMDNVPRQVVPGDFSFLSLADRSVVSAIAKLITTLTGVEDNKPILLGTVAIENNKTSQTFAFGPATLLYNGLIYDLPKIKSSKEHKSFAAFMSRTYIYPKRVTVAPSPVYGKDLAQNVNVHYSMVFEVGRSNSGEEFTLNEIQTLPGISDTEGSEGVVSRPIFKEL